MNTLFYNGKAATFAGSSELIEDALVAVKGSEIVYAGKAGTEEQKKITNDIKFDREIDLAGNLILPGFKNCHTHSAMTLFRSAADDMKLDEWLTKQIFPREALLTPEDVYYGTRLACLEYLTSGITEICEMYFFPDDIARAAEDSGIRCVQCTPLNNYFGSIDEVLDWYERLNNRSDLTAFRLGVHAEYTCSEELLKEVARVAGEKKAPIYLHMSETLKEVEECRERHGGLTPVEYLDSLGLFEYGGVFFHGVHVTDRDIEIIKEKKIAVVTNPASNLKLASGIAPVERYLKEGITLALGTDGPASNNCLDMFREMFLTTALSKCRENDASAADAISILEAACSKGADAIGTPMCNSLSPGKKADLIVIDLHRPNMQPENNTLKNIVYSGSKENVKLTMIDGVIRYEDGKFNVGDDPGHIYSEVRKSVDRIEASV